MLLNVLLLLVSVFSTSTAVIMIKASTVPPFVLASFRLLVAAIVLTPVFLRDLKRHRASYTMDHLKASVIPGLILAIHFMSWIIGARMTPSANASLIVNLVPVAMPLLLLMLVNEKLNRNEIIATAIALCGVTFLTAADLNLSSTYFIGDLVCFGSMLFYATYMALGRRNRHHPTVWLYLVPLYYVAAVVCIAVAVWFDNPFQAYGTKDVLLILGLGIIPTVLGHSLINYAMKHFRGQIVSILNMCQFIIAGFMGYFLFGEIPEWTFYVASILLVMSALVAVGVFNKQKKLGITERSV